MEDFNTNLGDDLELGGNAKDNPTAPPAPAFEEEGTIGALRQLTQAVTKMQTTLSEFVKKFDKYTKAGKFTWLIGAVCRSALAVVS